MSKKSRAVSKEELLETQINESRLKTAQALAQIGNWELDLTTNELYWSDEIFNLFEIDKNRFEASYEAFLNAIHPDDRDIVNSAYLNSLETKQKYRIGHRLLMSDGRIKYVEEQCENYFDEEGKPLKSVGTVQDITELKLTEKELQKTLSFFRGHQLALDESSIVTKADLAGNIIYANDNFCKVSGYSREEALGKPHSLLRHPDSSKKTFEELWKTIQSKKPWKGVLKNRGKQSDYWVDISIIPILNENEEIVEYIAVRHDITKMVKQKERLDHLANKDPLTGLYNRNRLIEDINKSSSSALAILNIDNFSQIKDFYGHQIGNQILTIFAKNLEEISSEYDFRVYHLERDDFIIYKNSEDRHLTIRSVEEILKRISEISIIFDTEELNLTFTIGLSFEDTSKILTTANMALKVGKRENKHLVIYSDEISLNDEYKNNILWARKIKYAIDNNNIVPVFQGIVNNKTETIEKYESLVRLQDENKLITPFFFLEISKRVKYYTEITKIMIEKSFKKFSQKSFDFSINLTIDDILNKDIQIFIFKMLELYNIGERVVFEIVESESIENFKAVEEFIRELKVYNCKIAIDDFGTGYSNFEYLMKVNADFLKIDGSLIKDLCTNPDSELVVSTIVSFAKKKGILTIAEFVENEEIFNKVKELGIDYSQGYYFSKPNLVLEN